MRLSAPVDRILKMLDEHGASATFFFLGSVAREQSDLVRRVAAAGHEVASHGMTHTMVDKLTPSQFRAELDDSARLLESLSGRPVRGFRAPTFSVTHRTAWALDALAEEGYAYDSSVFPVRHDRYGVPDAPTFPHVAAGPGGGRILEIPPVTLPLAGRNLPLGGGGWLRLFPVRLLGARLRRLERQGRPGMIDLHPWELDPEQPPLPLSRRARWRHRVGLRGTARKLRWFLRQFRFTSVERQFDRLQGIAMAQFTYGSGGRA